MDIIKGDLLDLAEAGNFDVIIHGCNCFCAMNSGIAGQISQRYPAAKLADAQTHRGHHNKLGNYTYAPVSSEPGFVIVNAYTQYDTNSSGDWKDRFEYAAFELILKKVAKQWPGCSIGLPMIGMGLAGGDADRILKIIEDFADQYDGQVTVVEYSR